MTVPEPFDPQAYWEKRLSARYGPAGVGHTGLAQTYNRWMYRVRRRVFARLLRNPALEPAGARVLDIGSGTGFYIERWRTAGVAKIEGVDISPTAVDNLRRRFPAVTFHHGNIADPGAVAGLRGSFDIVTAMDVMFHVVDDRDFELAIRRIHSVLREGGVFIFSDNFLHVPERRLRHIVHRSLDHVLRVLDRAGFEVVERRPMLFLMTAPVDSTWPPLRGAWWLISRAAGHGELLGWITGALLYPLELALTRIMRESPTTEVMVCKRRRVPTTSDDRDHAIESQ